MGTLGEPVHCGSVLVHPQDIVAADEEGIVVIPGTDQTSVYEIAHKRAEKDVALSLEEWKANHQANIARLLLEKGSTE